MNRRDQLAAAALTAIYSDIARNDYDNLSFELVASLAYRFADCMIAESGQATTANRHKPIGYANMYVDGTVGMIRETASQCIDNSCGDVSRVVRIYVEEEIADNSSDL